MSHPQITPPPDLPIHPNPQQWAVIAKAVQAVAAAVEMITK